MSQKKQITQELDAHINSASIAKELLALKIGCSKSFSTNSLVTQRIRSRITTLERKLNWKFSTSLSDNSITVKRIRKTK